MKPALALAIEKRAIRLRIANAEEVKPETSKNVSCFKFLKKESAMTADWEEVIAGRKPVNNDTR